MLGGAGGTVLPPVPAKLYLGEFGEGGGKLAELVAPFHRLTSKAVPEGRNKEK